MIKVDAVVIENGRGFIEYPAGSREAKKTLEALLDEGVEARLREGVLKAKHHLYVVFSRLDGSIGNGTVVRSHQYAYSPKRRGAPEVMHPRTGEMRGMVLVQREHRADSIHCWYEWDRDTVEYYTPQTEDLSWDSAARHTAPPQAVKPDAPVQWKGGVY